MEKMRTIFEVLLHEGIHMYKPRNSLVPLHQLVREQQKTPRNKKGAIGVVRSKEDLSTPSGTRGYIITTKETLLEDFRNLSHWTPNVYNYLKYSDPERRHLKGHTEKNLQQINAFVVDIDTKKQPYPEILTAALDHSVGAPTLLLETPRGFQAYFVLDSPLFISNRNEFRGLAVAKRIAENIRRSLAKVLQGVDISCNDFGFFRVPNTENVRWFSEKMVYALHDLISWSRRQDDDANRGLFVFESKKRALGPTDAEWFRSLLEVRHVKGSSGQIGRDNLMYTLALACYSAGKGQGETLDLLDEYNSALERPIRHNEVQKIVKSAFKGRFKGASKTYIRELLESWLPGVDVPVTNNGGWYKFKKERKDRARSHYDEWESDLLVYIQSQTSPAEPVKWSTQNAICEAVGMSRSTFNEVVRRSRKILIKRMGTGRGGRTGLTSVSVLLQCALTFNQTHRALYYEAISLMKGSPENVLSLWELECQLELLTQTPEPHALAGGKINSS